jgi:hypothetical protein
MSTSRPYVRAFMVGAVWSAAIAVKMVSRHPGHWSTYPPQNVVALVFAWVITALLLGMAATRSEKFRSWWGIGIGTVIGWFVVFGLMLFIVERLYGPPARPKFKSTGEMMVYFASEAATWVKKDRGIALDYSVDSIKIVEEELARISKDIDKTNPPHGTFGLATGYGAYIGEVLRRRDGGSWAVDHPDGGSRSYPLTTKSNITVFPVAWCWKRLTVGEEDNVYHKALLFSQSVSSITNITGQTGQR